MKRLLYYFVIPLTLAGCSKKATEQSSDNTQQRNLTTNGLPFAVTVVNTAESKEVEDIMNQSCSLFKNKDYDKLEALAAKYRLSKESCENGEWKLTWVYNGFDISSDESDATWENRQKAIREWIQAKPDSITARVALANNLTDFAWKARGNGFSDSVSNETWNLFGERLDQAATVLEEAKKLKEKCPVYWLVMMEIALGQQMEKSEFNSVFEQAIHEWPDYTPYYHERAMFLLPRWYGTEGEWDSDLAKSADRIGGEQGDILYAQVAWAMHEFSEHYNIFEDTKGLSWERIDRGWDAAEKTYSNTLAVLNIHAHMAGLAGDNQKARKCFLKTDGKVVVADWDDENQFIEAANWAFGK